MPRKGASSSAAADPPQVPFVQAVTGGIRLAVRVHPRARRARLQGMLGEALKVEVTAAPESGAANEAVIALIADSLNVPRSAVRIVAGFTSRNKTLEVLGLDPAAASTKLKAALP